MSRILYAWELGDGFGHVTAFRPLALELRQRGHEVTLIVRDLPRAHVFLGRHGFPTYQAPIWLHESSVPVAVNYSELLFGFGFLNEQSLMGLVRGWHGLFEHIDPDLLLIDHAPTALLAARAWSGKRALFGTGFYSPPRRHPLPSFRPWLKIQPERLAESDRRVLEVVNRVVNRLGGEPLVGMADLFQADEDFLCTFRELDHYPGRESVRYWGPICTTDEGTPPEWPAGRGAKILAYLLPTYRDFETALRSLAELPQRTLVVHTPRQNQDGIRQRGRSSNIAFSPGLVKMARAVEECDLVMCHAGHGTVALALLTGRPLLLLPIDVEQVLTSRNVVTYGAGKMVNVDSRNPPYWRLISEILGNPAYAERASAFAEAHRDFSQADQLAAVVARCEELLA